MSILKKIFTGGNKTVSADKQSEGIPARAHESLPSSASAKISDGSEQGSTPAMEVPQGHTEDRWLQPANHHPKSGERAIRKPRKPQAIFGRVLHEGTWFEQRKDGVYVRRRYGRRWMCVSFDVIRDYAVGQFPLKLDNDDQAMPRP